MRLDLTSLMFNMNLLNGTGTPSWGTALGQGENHKFTYDGCEEILIGMLFCKIKNMDDVFCPLGKGGKKQDGYEYVLASKFEKVYVNDVLIDDAEFVLLIVKQLVASQSAIQHIGRRILKYNPKITYEEEPINQDCFNKIIKKLNLKEKAAWFVSDINVKNQDELHFTAKIVDRDKPKEFYDSAARSAFCENRAEVVVKDDVFVKKNDKKEYVNSYNFDEPIIVHKKNKIINLK